MQRDIQQATGNSDFDGFLSTGYIVIPPAAASISQTVRDNRGPVTVPWYAKGGAKVNRISISGTFEN